MGYYPGLSECTQRNHKGPYNREAEEQEAKRERAIWRCYAAGFENEGRGHEPRMQMASRSWKKEKNKKQKGSFSGASRKNTALLIHFGLLTSRTVR